MAFLARHDASCLCRLISGAAGGAGARTVYDSQTGNPIRGALIKVVRGEQSAVTDDKNTETVKMGLVGNVSYKLGQDHKLLFKNFYTADSSDETRFLYGFSNGNTADERDTRLRYLRESMWTSQASGQHYLKPLGNGLLEWRLAHARSAREEPDLCETIYRSEEGKNRYLFSPEGQSGFR